MVAEVILFSLLAKQVKVQGIYVGHPKSFNEMNRTINQLNINPVIDQVYTFEKAVQAYEHLAKGAFGKIVIKVSQ